MGQSLVKNYIHIVFSTKNREALIFPPFEEELHKYLGGICNHLECQVIKVGGFVDHVHILCMLSKKISVMKLVEELKTSSSKWMKTRDKTLEFFYWQDGYGAFSVDAKGVDRVASYIENQHVHHKGKAYKDELISLLKRHEVDFDEKYIWL